MYIVFIELCMKEDPFVRPAKQTYKLRIKVENVQMVYSNPPVRVDRILFGAPHPFFAE